MTPSTFNCRFWVMRWGRHLLKQKILLLSTFLLFQMLSTKLTGKCCGCLGVFVMLEVARFPTTSSFVDQCEHFALCWETYWKLEETKAAPFWKQVINFIPAPWMTCVCGSCQCVTGTPREGRICQVPWLFFLIWHV